MIKSVTITNHLGESLILELTRPDLSGFIVKEIDGLGPVKANINTTKMATTDGTAYNSASAGQRDITFQLQFYTTGIESIEDIRHRSYKYFPLKKQVTIRVETDNRISEAIGYVESNEPNIFSNQEGCTVVVVCPDPYFYSINTNETIFYGIEPAFEFPLINDSSTEALIELSTIKNRMEENVFYEGDGEVGMSINIHALGDASNVTIYNLTSREQFSIDTSKFPSIMKTELFNETDIEWTTNSYMVCSTISNTWHITTNDDYPDDSMVSGFIPVIPGTTIEYTIKTNTLPSTGLIVGFDCAQHPVVTVVSNPVRGTTYSGTFEIPSNVYYIVVDCTDHEDNSLVYQKRIVEDQIGKTSLLWLDNAYINASTGYVVEETTATADNAMVSDFIPVKGVDEILYELTYYTVTKRPIIAAYDANKEYLGAEVSLFTSPNTSHTLKGVYNVPSSAAYVRIVCDVNTSGSFMVPKNRIWTGDTITINTTHGNKGVTLLRQGEVYNIFNSCINKNTSWFQLSKGDNLFAYRAESGTEHLQFRIENKIRYNGV